MGAVANASPLLLLQGYSQCLLQLGSLHLEKYVFLSLKWKKKQEKRWKLPSSLFFFLFLFWYTTGPSEGRKTKHTNKQKMTKKIINKQDLLFPARAGGNLRLLTPLRNILHYTSSTREASNASLCFPGAAPPPLHIPSIANSTVLLPNLPESLQEWRKE